MCGLFFQSTDPNVSFFIYIRKKHVGGFPLQLFVAVIVVVAVVPQQHQPLPNLSRFPPFTRTAEYLISYVDHITSSIRRMYVVVEVGIIC